MKKANLDQYDPLIEKETVEIKIRVPREIKELLDQKAEQHDTSLNKMIQHILVTWFRR